MEKIIKLEDFNNKSLDNIVELYRSGHVLENTYSTDEKMQYSTEVDYCPATTQSTVKTIAQSSIQQMQLPSYSTATITFIVGTLAGLGMILILRRK